MDEKAKKEQFEKDVNEYQQKIKKEAYRRCLSKTSTEKQSTVPINDSIAILQMEVHDLRQDLTLLQLTVYNMENKNNKPKETLLISDFSDINLQ